MKALLRKEIQLTLHPTSLLFLILSAMLLIPNYPYYVIFFYTSLGIFFTSLSGRENGDIGYSLLLPVRKRDVVTARFLLVIAMQLTQILICIPFAILRQHLPVPANVVGMEANIALFGISFVMMGIFDAIFFHIYYKDCRKVGCAFAAGSIVEFLFILLAETLVHFPAIAPILDTFDNEYIPQKLLILFIGILIYTFILLLSHTQAQKNFAKQDL